jgi:hypothetical protein
MGFGLRLRPASTTAPPTIAESSNGDDPPPQEFQVSTGSLQDEDAPKRSRPSPAKYISKLLRSPAMFRKNKRIRVSKTPLQRRDERKEARTRRMPTFVEPTRPNVHNSSFTHQHDEYQESRGGRKLPNAASPKAAPRRSPMSLAISLFSASPFRSPLVSKKRRQLQKSSQNSPRHEVGTDRSAIGTAPFQGTDNRPVDGVFTSLLTPAPQRPDLSRDHFNFESAYQASTLETSGTFEPEALDQLITFASTPEPFDTPSKRFSHVENHDAASLPSFMMKMSGSFDLSLDGDEDADEDDPVWSKTADRVSILAKRQAKPSIPKRQAKPKQYTFDREEVFCKDNALGRKGARVRWDEEPQAQEVPQRTQTRRQEQFMGVNATMVGRQPSVLRTRLSKWVKRDDKFRGIVLDVASSIRQSSSTLEARVMRNIRAFCQSKSLGGGGSGTRPKASQAAVEHALVAANWSEPLTTTEIRYNFGTSLAFAKKIVAMAEEEAINSDRKSRRDTRRILLTTHVREWQHDDYVNRIDNGGKTSRNQIWVGTDEEGREIRHPRRIWPCVTNADKLKLFLASAYYDRYVDAIFSDEYFAERLCPSIREGEKKLRGALGKPRDIRLTRKVLFTELEKRFIEPKKTAKWPQLVQLLHHALFDQHLERSNQNFDEEIEISILAFTDSLCPCVVNPKMESCVDTLDNQIRIYAKSINDSLSASKQIQKEFDKCECENCKITRDKSDHRTTFNDLCRDFSDHFRLVEFTCCPRVEYPNFKTARDTKAPRLIPRKCTDPSMICESCGVDRKFEMVKKCPVWSTCNIMIKTQEYLPMPRSGLKSNGKPRTQLELCPVKFPLRILFVKLLDKLRVGRRHRNDTWWSNRSIRNCDSRITQRRPHFHYDFAATMRLFAIYKENCHEDAHVADFVSIGAMNPRMLQVQEIQEDGSTKSHYVRENWATHSFFDTISPGKKTDAIGIRHSLHEDLVLMFKDVLEKDPHWTLGADIFLEVLAIASDNCANQNKCAKHYWNMLNLYMDIAPRLIVIYLQHKKRMCQQGDKPTSKDRSVAPFLIDTLSIRLNDDTSPSSNMDPQNPWPLKMNTEYARIPPEEVEEILSDVDARSICSSLDSIGIPSYNTEEAPAILITSASSQGHVSQHQSEVRGDSFLGMEILVEPDDASAAANILENPWPLVEQGDQASDESNEDQFFARLQIHKILARIKQPLVQAASRFFGWIKPNLLDVADDTDVGFSEVADYSVADGRSLCYNTYWPDDDDASGSEDDDASGTTQISSGEMTSDFLDCLDPSVAEFMVGAQTVEEINERFGNCLNPDWFDLLSFQIRHQYTEPDQGRGAHDGEGGAVKTLCYNGELAGERSPNATGVNSTMTEKRGQKAGIKQLYPVDEWSQQGDRRLLSLKLHTITHRIYKLFLENWANVVQLRDAGWQHVHYIDRQAEDPVGTTKTIVGTSTFKEVYFPRLQVDAIGKPPSERSFTV